MPALAPFQLLMLATIASMLIIQPMWRVAPHLGLLDHPDSRKVHRAPVPRVGGWGLTFGTLLPLAVWMRTDPLLQSFAGGALVLFLFGVWDDARGIGHWPKFVGQVIAASLVVYHGDLYVSYVPFLDSPLSAAIGKPFTVFALVGVINAINHSDGLDGLAAGVSMLSLMAFAILGYLGHSALAIGIALATMGGALGFLRYNSYPARVFMGDCGSQVLGFTLGFLAVYVTQRADTAMSSALPLLLLGMPIADILVVLYRRIRGHMNWFKATRNHLHHRLLDLGFGHHQTVIIIYSLQALLVVSALLLRYESDAVVAGAYLAVICGTFILLGFGERRGWHVTAASGRLAWLSAVVDRLERSGWLGDLPRIVISVAVPVLMLIGALWVARVPRDVAAVAALLAAVVATEICRSRACGSLLVRLAVYTAAITSVYLIITYPGLAQRPVQGLTIGIVASLATAFGAYLRFASGRNFGTTPTDYLMLFVVLALLIFGAIDVSSRALVEIVVYAVVVLYSCEVLMGRTARRWNTLHLVTLAALTIMAVRGVV